MTTRSPDTREDLRGQLNILQLSIELSHRRGAPEDVFEQFADAHRAESLVDNGQVERASMSTKVRSWIGATEKEVLQLIHIVQEIHNDSKDIIIQVTEQ